MKIRLRTGLSGVRIPAWEFPFAKTPRTTLGPIQPPMKGVWGLVSGRDVKLATQLHWFSRLRMTGTKPLLPIYTFTTCTGTINLLYCYYIFQSSPFKTSSVTTSVDCKSDRWGVKFTETEREGECCLESQLKYLHLSVFFSDHLKLTVTSWISRGTYRA
jgi:hypothetical protein